jgi:hypothetical protein
MAGSLRTGRKTIPVHPVRVRHVAPRRPRALDETQTDRRASRHPAGATGSNGQSAAASHRASDQLALAFAELRRAAYDGRPTVPELEAKIDRLLKVP